MPVEEVQHSGIEADQTQTSTKKNDKATSLKKEPDGVQITVLAKPIPDGVRKDETKPDFALKKEADGI